MDLAASGPVFAAGVGLWAASLALVSVAQCHAFLDERRRGYRSAVVRGRGSASLHGAALTPLSQPLPFFAYPFLAATLFGWAWVHYRNAA